MEPESLTRERWQQIEQLYNAALERAPDERAAFLTEACAGDEGLRREVESLLCCDDRAGSFIEEPALEIAARLEPENEARSLAGQRLDQYEILSLLGAGGMGEVWRARDSHLDREVAIKVLPAHLAQDGEALARFQREARAVAALSHPNILAIHDFGTAQGISYAVTELLEGETLRDRLERSALPWRKAVEIGIAVADGLAAAHAKGIIHRDLKPENIFLTADGRVKILDFGLARIRPAIPVSEKSQAVTRPMFTRPGIVLGTIGYMSPEQVRGDEADAPGDIFLLGCVLYEMVTGRRAFARETAVEELNAILNEAPPAMADSANHVPPELEYIVSHCLEKKPEERFQSAQDLAFALRTISLSPKRFAFSPLPSRFRPAVLIAALVITGAMLWLLFRGGWPGGSDKTAVRSIAVLPLVNNSPNPEEDYFADGMTDALIDNLGRIGALRVISRTSVMRYKGTKEPLPKIAQELKVDAVVEGTVQRFGDKVRISASLVHASDRQLWSHSYDDNQSNALAMQSRVAQIIAQEIRTRVTPQEQARIAQVHPVSQESLQLYYKGRYYWLLRTEDGWNRAIDYFQQAIEMDPNNAAAYAGLADSYILRETALSPAVAMSKAREAATRALAIDETLAEAHTSLAVVSLLHDWDWPTAEREFRLAIDLKPSYATAHHWYAEYLSAMGRHPEAIAAIKQAQELDPQSLIISRDVGWHYYLARRYDQAIDQCRHTLDLDPNFNQAHWLLGLAYVKKAMFEQAVAELQKSVALSPGPNNRARLGYACAASGRENEARKILDTLITPSEEMFVSPCLIAAIYGELGEQERAFPWLEKAMQKRSSLLVYLKVLPIFDSLRSGSGFREITGQVGLPE